MLGPDSGSTAAGIRQGQKYDPCGQLTTKNLIGTLALDPKREVAWMTMRKMIKSTQTPMQSAAEDDNPEQIDYHYVSTK
eukprot:6447356-Amphidinium_carterae.1